MKTIENHQLWCGNLKSKIPGSVQLRCEEKRSCRTSQPPSRRNSALFKTHLNTICTSQKVTQHHRKFPMAPKILQFSKYSCPGEVTTLTSATVILKARQIKEWKSQVLHGFALVAKTLLELGLSYVFLMSALLQYCQRNMKNSRDRAANGTHQVCQCCECLRTLGILQV